MGINLISMAIFNSRYFLVAIIIVMYVLHRVNVRTNQRDRELIVSML